MSFKKTLYTLLAVASFAGCKREETIVSPPVPGVEYLTTVRLVAVNQRDTTIADTATWVQLQPTVVADTTNAVLNLNRNTPYTLYVHFLDETKKPAEDITEDIRDRQNYHLVCFEVSDTLNLAVETTDRDNNSPQLPVGLVNYIAAGDSSKGRLHVTLHHQPNIKNGSCSLGSTDADVYFNVNIR